MLLNTACAKTAKELQESSKNRYFDCIMVVTGELDRVVENLSNQYGLIKRTESCGEKANEVVFPMGDIMLRVIQPLVGDTVFGRHLERFGGGICCVRENIPKERQEAELARYQALGIDILQSEEDETGTTCYLDTWDMFGGMIAIRFDKSPAVRNYANDRKQTQINVVTDDVDRTVAQLTNILEIGPWSIGTLNNQTVSNPGLLVDGRMCAPEFHFQLGITFYSNIEFEVIQPVKGPTVYQEYLNRHGRGFHHIKEVIPPEQWEKTLDGYKKEGMELSIRGSVGPTSFAYLDCEKAFDFVVELGDGIPANPLPEGYDEYSYPH